MLGRRLFWGFLDIDGALLAHRSQDDDIYQSQYILFEMKGVGGMYCNPCCHL